MAPPNPSSPRKPSGAGRTRYRVALTERGSVVERGEQVELWFVRAQDAWLRAPEHPSAAIESSSLDHEPAESGSERCPSGTIWVRTTELVLAPGTHLMLRQSAPRPRRLSVMNYLKQGLATTQRLVRERHFVVTGNYRLTPVGRMHVDTVAATNAGSESDDIEALSDMA